VDKAASQCLPEVDDEVLVAFEHGDPRRPCYIASLWNCRDEPPETSAHNALPRDLPFDTGAPTEVHAGEDRNSPTAGVIESVGSKYTMFLPSGTP
jgi:hypothetical protein